MSTDSPLWERYCTHVRSYPAVGMSLDISRMRFPDSFFATMQSSVDRAFAAMQQLEAGAIANPDEKRMVGHYWLRNDSLAPDASLRNAIREAKSAITAFSRSVHSGETRPSAGHSFSDAIIIGIGGSALGPQLLADALGSVDDPLRLHFCDNTDPDGMARLFQGLHDRLEKTLVIVISKSGGTVETRNGCLEAQRVFTEKGLSFGKHFVAVTSEGSKLDEQAKRENWLARFPMWDWVGGRTSLFSAVGLLPAALQGIDIDSFLDGAKRMDEITREEGSSNPAMLLALMWHFAGEGRGKKDMVVLPYKDRLVLFSKYLQQLVMESLGKEKDVTGGVVHQGIAVYGNKGSTDQHAYVQQLRDGVPNFFVTFIRVLRNFSPATRAPATELAVEPGVTSGDYLHGFLLGTRSALYENGRDSITVTLTDVSAASLGSLIALYERAVGFYATLVGINAYHQPGVEAGKKAASRIIELEKALVEKLAESTTAVSAEELAQRIAAPSEIESVFHILEYLAQNKRFGISKVQDGSPRAARFGMGTKTK